MFTYRFVCTLVFNVFFYSAFSQNDIHVDLVTGRPRVALPIVSIKNGTLSTDIALRYNGTGYRLGETEGNAGMGWNVDVNFSIYRMVRGLPDDLDLTDGRKGWLYGTQGASVNSFTPASDNNCTDWTTLNALASVDMEPDIFYVNAPGLSCSFVFDQNKTIRFLQNANLKVSYTRGSDNLIGSFTITNDQGIVYTFSSNVKITRQTVKFKGATVTHFIRDYNYYASPATFYQTWKLSSLKGLNNELISFRYDTSPELMESKSYVRKVNSSLTGLDTLYSINDDVYDPLLENVTAAYQQIDFEWANQMISKITISAVDVNTVVGLPKVFDFVYREIKNPSESTYYGGIEMSWTSRNFLYQVRTGTNCLNFPAFSFEYYWVSFTANTTSIPIKKNYPQDLYGYYNNASVSNSAVALIPQVYQNTVATNGERFRTSPRSGWTAIGSAPNRAVNASTAHYGALSRIYFQTGGYGEITYQPCTYYDPNSGTDVQGGGIRVASIKLTTGANQGNNIVKNYEYTQANGTSSGKWTTPPMFAFLDGNNVVLSPDNLTESALMYERVSIIEPGRGKTVYTHLLPAMYNTLTYNSNDWLATKTKIARQVISGSCRMPLNFASVPIRWYIFFRTDTYCPVSLKVST